MAAKPGSAALEVQHQDGCLVTSGGTVVLEQLAGEVRVRQLGAAAVIGLEHPSGQPVAAADFSVGKVGAGCVAIAACNCASTSAIKHTHHPVPRVLLATPSTVLPPRRRRRGGSTVLGVASSTRGTGWWVCLMADVEAQLQAAMATQPAPTLPTEKSAAATG